jgi:hypothetical protein
MSSNRNQFSDNPSAAPSSSLAIMEDDTDGGNDGIVRDSRLRRMNLCQSRNLVLLFLVVLESFIAGTDIFESKDLSLPEGDDDFNELAQPSNEQVGDDLMDVNGGDGGYGGDTINKVNLNANNPNRDETGMMVELTRMT